MAKSFSSGISTGKGSAGGHDAPSGFSTQIMKGQDKRGLLVGTPRFSNEINRGIDKFQAITAARVIREQQRKLEKIKKRKKDLEEALKFTPDAERLEKQFPHIFELKRIPTAFNYVKTKMRAEGKEASNEMIAAALHKMIGDEKLDETESRILQLGWKRLYARAKARGQTEFSSRNLIPRGSYYSPKVGWY